MRSERIRLLYELTFETPFHCGTGLRAGLVDRVAQRDASGYLVVPGSTIKGALRAGCEGIAGMIAREGAASLGEDLPHLRADSPHNEQAALAAYGEPTLIDQIFGSRVNAGSLFFDDAVMIDETRRFFSDPLSETRHRRMQAFQTQERTQVSMARATGAGRRGLLFTSEYGMSGTTFKSAIYGTLRGVPLSADTGDREDGTYPLLLLLAGVASLERLGAQRSSGFGRCYVHLKELRVNRTVRDPLDYLHALSDFALYYADRQGRA